MSIACRRRFARLLESHRSANKRAFFCKASSKKEAPLQFSKPSTSVSTPGRVAASVTAGCAAPPVVEAAARAAISSLSAGCEAPPVADAGEAGPWMLTLAQNRLPTSFSNVPGTTHGTLLQCKSIHLAPSVIPPPSCLGPSSPSLRSPGLLNRCQESVQGIQDNVQLAIDHPELLRLVVLQDQ